MVGSGGVALFGSVSQLARFLLQSRYCGALYMPFYLSATYNVSIFLNNDNDNDNDTSSASRLVHA